MTDLMTDRSQYLGGSDVAAVLGVGRKTPLQLYREKIGEAEPEPETRAMRLGKQFEPIILDEYRIATGRRLLPAVTLVHPEFPFIRGHVDAVSTRDGEDDLRLVEAKSSENDAIWGETESDDVPLPYLFQGTLYLELALLEGMRTEKCDYPALLNRWKLPIFVVPYDAELGREIVRRLVGFWTNHVLLRVPPEPSTADEAWSAWGHKPAASIPLDGDIANMIRSRARGKALVKEGKALIEKAELDLTKRMQGAELIRHGDAVVLKRKLIDGSTLDIEALDAEHPGASKRFRREYTYQKFIDTKETARV